MIEIDGVRFRDIGAGGVVGLAIAGFATLFAASEVVSILAGEGGSLVGALAVGALGVFIGGILAYEDASPEFDGYCEHCGERILINSGSSDTTEHVIVRTTAEPRRLRVGGRSIVTERRKDEHAYCSPACASSDTRYVVPSGAVDATDPVAQEVSERAD